MPAKIPNKRFKSREPSAVSAAFLENQSFIKKFLARFLTSQQDIEDVSQETYLRAFHAEKAQTVRSPKAFLFRVAKNIALNELTKKARLLTDYIEDSVSPDVIEEESSPEEQAAAQEKLTVFCRAVSTLPPQCRQAFLLRKVYGLSHKDISQRLGIAVSTVEKHVASGLMRCNVYLNERGHSTATAAVTLGTARRDGKRTAGNE
jgi:RNA polymerase sigma factor (sigma-70 family)